MQVLCRLQTSVWSCQTTVDFLFVKSTPFVYQYELPFFVEVYENLALSPESNKVGSMKAAELYKMFLKELVSVAPRITVDCWHVSDGLVSCIRIGRAYNAFAWECVQDFSLFETLRPITFLNSPTSGGGHSTA